MKGKCGYPLLQHGLALVPMLAVLAVVMARLGSEQAVEDYCTAQREAHPWMTDWVKWVSDLANVGYYAAYGALLYLGIRRSRANPVEFVGGYLVSLLFIILTVNVIKFCVGRPRPWSDDPVEPFTSDGDNHSFPSGHVTETLVTAVPWGQRYGRIWLPLLCGLSPAFVVLTRLYLGEHHPSDFLGSILVGSFGMYVGWRSRPLWRGLFSWCRSRPGRKHGDGEEILSGKGHKDNHGEKKDILLP